MNPDLNVNKQRNSTPLGQHIFTDIVYLKQRQEDMLSLVFKKLNLCQVMPASRGVNPLATSHIVEHLSSICIHSWSHDKLNLYFSFHCLNKIDMLGTSDSNQKHFFNTAKKSNLHSRLYLGDRTLQDVI